MADTPRIFLSYARGDDEPFVRRLHGDLAARGLDVWFDRVSMPNRALTFLQEIRDAIAARERLVLVVGPRAVTSPYVEAEWRFALEVGKAITPILRLGDYPLLPDELKLLDAPDFRSDADYSARLDALVRQLGEAVAPMGKLVAVPSLPPHFLAQPERLRALKDAVMADIRRPVVVTGQKAEGVRLGIHGMGGIGKSVLAAALARDHEVRRAFPDGIIWVPLGQQPSVIDRQRDVAKALGDPGLFDSEFQGKGRIGELLADKAVLLILDDAWQPAHAEAFDALGPRCRMIITTRDAALITALGGTQHQVQLLTEAQSAALIAEWAGCQPDALPPAARDVLSHCGRLPLALAICGALVRDGKAWGDLVAGLGAADLDFVQHEHRSVLATIKVGIDALAPDEQRRFAELSVFPADETVPEAAAVALWTHTGPMADYRARGLLERLARRSLVRLDTEAPKPGEAPRRFFSLHDLLRDYAMTMAGDPAALHAVLLDAYRKHCPDGWPTGPNDGYFFERLAYHLVEAGQRDELRTLLTQFPWLEKKLETTDPNALIADYDFVPDGESLRLIQGAIRLSSHVLATNKAQLAGQLLGRMLGEPDPPIVSLLDQAKSWRGRPWLRPLHPCLTAPGGPLLRTLEGHTAGVNAVSVFPDGRRAISASEDRTLKIWDIESGREIRTLEGHTSGVNAVSVFADGRRAVSASDDGTLKVWDIETGREVRTLKGHTHHSVRAVSVFAEGRRAVSACYDRTLKVWDLESGREVRTLEGHTGGVNAVSVFPDGRRAISASEDRTLKVWDIEEGREVRTLEGHKGWVNAVSIFAEGRWAISVSSDRTLKVWDLESGREVRTLQGHTGYVMAASVFAEGRRAISASWDNTLKVWDLEGGQEVRTLEGHRGGVNAVSVFGEGRRAISASADRTLKVWDLETGQQVRTLEGHMGAVFAVSIFAEGRLAISAAALPDNTLKVWDLESGREVRTLVGHVGRVNAVSVFADGRRAISASDDGTVKAWGIESGQEVLTLGGHTGDVSAVSVFADGRRAISASHDKTLKVWSLDTGEVVATFTGDGPMAACAVAPDGVTIVAGDRLGRMYFLRLEGDESEGRRQ